MRLQATELHCTGNYGQMNMATGLHYTGNYGQMLEGRPEDISKGLVEQSYQKYNERKGMKSGTN